METREREAGRLDEDGAWALIRELKARAVQSQPRPCGFRVSPSGHVEVVAVEVGQVAFDPSSEPSFHAAPGLPPAILQMLALYLPLCLPADSGGGLVIGQVGQSLDGQIATASGASRYVTGPESIRHMHRLRALFDAVIVGARTVESDDPQLTTREAVGDNATRVVIDPSLRLPSDRRLYRDGVAPTLIVCRRGAQRGGRTFGHAEIVEVEGDELTFPSATIAALRERGLHRLFIEGGGITVSRFVEARALDRLHVTVCPLLIGRGRPGIVLPPVNGLEEAARPRSRRFAFGDDVLFDCELRRTG